MVKDGVTLTLLDGNGNPVLDGNGNAITTTTSGGGTYSFTNIEPGEYQIEQTDPSGYSSVSDGDDTVDGASDNDTNNNTNDNILRVSLAAGETDSGNDFYDQLNGTISGTVQEDTTGDGNGDTALGGITVTLKDSNGDTVATTVTISDGTYSFTDVTPGDYTVEQTDLSGYSSINDTDSTADAVEDDAANSNPDDNTLAVTLLAGETDSGNDFVDGLNGSISGTVQADTTGDNSGDTALSGVTITLKDNNGDPVATTTTDNNGNYSFSDIAPGDYTVEQTDPNGYVSVSDGDSVDDDGGAGGSDDDTNSNSNDNILAISLIPGESDTGNNFVDEQTGTISGAVTDNSSNPLVGVTIELFDTDTTTTVATTTTAGDGTYSFADVTPGNYEVREIDPTNYVSVSEEDSNNDGTDDTDLEDSATNNDNILTVVLADGESDTGNDFVDQVSGTGFISGTVLEDTDGDGIGDTPLSGVTINLSGTASDSTTTASDGTYSFGSPGSPLANGNYTITQINPTGYGDVDESDGTNDNSISVTISDDASTGNNFVDGLEGSISGVVWSDLDNNGIEGSLEDVVSGIDVTLTGGGADGLLSTTGDNTTDTLTTDANGAYSFTGLNPGEEYQVSFPTSATGYTGLTSQDSGSDDTIDSDANVSTGNTATITLTPGEDKTDVDAGLLPTNTITIPGTPSSETLTGTSGDDVIAGYKGQDTLTGGDGNDTFFFNETSDGVDVITDFTSGSDEIDLSQILANETTYTAGNPFDQGYAIVTDYPLGGAMVQIDFDGTGGSDLVKSVVLIDNLAAAGVDVTGSDSTDTDFIF